MNNLSRRLLATARWIGLFAPLFLLGFAGGFTLHSSLVSAQAAQVRVTELQCSRDPETVAISNQDINDIIRAVQARTGALDLLPCHKSYLFEDFEDVIFVMLHRLDNHGGDPSASLKRTNLHSRCQRALIKASMGDSHSSDKKRLRELA